MKKLLIITGAGASVEFGMPSVKAIDDLFDTWSKELMILEANPDVGIYAWIKSKVKDYSTQNAHNRTDVILSFENILFAIQNLAALYIDKEHGKYNNVVSTFISLEELPNVIDNNGFLRKLTGYDFRRVHSYLVDKLLKHLRHICSTLSSKYSDKLTQLRGLLETLRTEFEIGVVNLNYDNVILSALPDLNTGFDKKTGEFQRRLLYKSKWNFCYHLHGSVHFDMKGGRDTEMHKIFWNSDLNSNFTSNSSGRNSVHTSQGLDHLTSAIIAGLDKSNQLVREPFASYFMQLDKCVYEAEAILFIGYGFADQHLNSVFPFIRYDKSKRRNVVIVDWINDDGSGLSHRHDAWSFGLGSTIPYNSQDMRKAPFKESEPGIYFKKRNIFEKSHNPEYPLAVWYNGLLSMCSHSKKLVDVLLGNC